MTPHEYAEKLRKRAADLRGDWLESMAGLIANQKTAEELEKVADVLDSGILKLSPVEQPNVVQQRVRTPETGGT